MLAPEAHRIPPGDVRPVALDADFLLDWFQPTREPQLLAGVHQVQMRGGNVEAEGCLKERHVEALAVERHQQVGGVERRTHVLGRQVVVPDEGGGLTILVEGDGGDDVAVVVQPGGLDVEEAGALAEVLVEPPAVPGGEGVVEEGGVAGVETRSGFVDELLDALPGLGTDGGGVEIVPVSDVVAPESAFGGLADAADGDEGVLDAHYS